MLDGNSPPDYPLESLTEARSGRATIASDNTVRVLDVGFVGAASVGHLFNVPTCTSG